MPENKSVWFVTTTVPTAGMGSSVVLYRHLSRLEDFDVVIIASAPPSSLILPTRAQWTVTMQNEESLWGLIRPPRYFPGSLRMRAILSTTRLLRSSPYRKPSIILNQLGKNSILSYFLSKAAGIPLGLFIHDPWQNWVSRKTCNLDADFMNDGWAQRIVQHAAVVWPVTRELAELYQIGDNDKARVLRPIPEGNDAPHLAWNDRFGNKPVMVSAGSFHSHQLAVFQAFSAALRVVNGQLIIISKLSDVMRNALEANVNVTCLRPFESNSMLLEFLRANASCLLVPAFYGKDFSRFRYSFPSKLLEFVQIGIPVVIVSESRTPVGKWARERGWLAYLQTTSPIEVEKLVSAFINRSDWQRMADQSREAARGEFNAEAIQRQFLLGLLEALR